MEFRLHGIRYAINVESVAIVVVPNSPMVTQAIDLYTTQQNLQQRAVDAGRESWGDDEIIAEAIIKLLEKDPSGTLVLEKTEALPGLPSPVIPDLDAVRPVVLTANVSE